MAPKHPDLLHVGLVGGAEVRFYGPPKPDGAPEYPWVSLASMVARCGAPERIWPHFISTSVDLGVMAPTAIDGLVRPLIPAGIGITIIDIGVEKGWCDESILEEFSTHLDHATAILARRWDFNTPEGIRTFTDAAISQDLRRWPLALGRAGQ